MTTENTRNKPLPNANLSKTTMFYDGGCPLCAREVAHYRRLVTGVQAFRAIWKELPYYRVLARLTSAPWIIKPLEIAYRKFANHRYEKRSGCNSTSCS